MDIKNYGKSFASYFENNKTAYDDTQITESEQELDISQQDQDNSNVQLDHLSELIQNALFGLRGIENFTLDKKGARQHFYNLLTAFNSNYSVDEDELPDNISQTSKVVFIVRFIENLLEILSMDITKAQHEMLENLIKFALDVIVEVSSI